MDFTEWSVLLQLHGFARRGGDSMKCELCDEEAYGMIDGLVAICWDCDTSCGSFEPSVEVTA